MKKLSDSNKFDILMGASGLFIVLVGIYLEDRAGVAHASFVGLLFSIAFIVTATTIYRQKHTTKDGKK